MGWWSKRLAKKSGEVVANTEQETHASPAFEALSNWLDTIPEPRVLDLGSASGANLDYFAELSARLQVVDLFHGVEEYPGGPGRREQAADQMFRELLPTTAAGVYHAILVWDLFNYLSRRQMRALGDRLAELSHPGTRALAMVSNLPRIPDTAPSFRIVDRSSLAYATGSERSRSNPRWPPGEVQKAMGAFEVERSFLLRHGIQEFLFVRSGDLAA